MKLLSPALVLLAAGAIAVAPAAGVPEQAPKRGGIVVFGPIQEPSCLNPLVPVCGSGILAFFYITEKVLVPPFLVAPDFTARPRLVSRVSYTRKAPFTLVYEIRPNARWSDGVQVSARDFVFAHRAIRKHLTDDDPGLGAHGLVSSIRPLGSKKVEVVLTAPDADWRRTLFAFVLPRHALVGEDLTRIWTDGVDNPKTGAPIGNGPFLVDDWERGKQLTLVRNPRYWGPHVSYLDRLVVRFCSGQACASTAMIETLRQGETDLMMGRDPSLIPEIRQIPGTSVLPMPSNGWEHIALRQDAGGHPALESKLVRRALAYGIDRAEIVRRLFDGFALPYRESQSAAFLNTSRYYRANWSGYRHRPELARDLLERAGCRRGIDGIRLCDGQRLSLRFFTPAGNAIRRRFLELVRVQLGRIGIEVVPIFTVGQTLFTQVMPSGEFDAAVFAFFVGETIGGKDVFGCAGIQNYTGYCQRLVTTDLDAGGRLLGARQRAGVVNRADRRVARDVPVIPLYQLAFVLAFRKAVRNLVPAPNNPLWNAENWWLER